MSHKDSGLPAGTTAEAPAAAGGNPVSLVTVIVVFLLALGLRLGYVLSARRPVQFPDEKQYLNIADNFLLGNGLAVTLDAGTGELLHYPEEVQRPPVYPLTLALAQRLGLGVEGIRVIQAVIGALTCVMVYLLARELVGEWPARIAGLVAAVEPFSVYFTGLILSETLFLLLFVTSWYYVVRMWREAGAGAGTTRWLASCLVAGLLGAAAVLTRSEALATYLLVPVAWLIVGPKRLQGFAVGLAMLFVLAVGMTPWVARNYKRTWNKEQGGRIVFTTLKVGESLYEAVGPFATGGPNKENTAWPREADALFGDEHARNQYLVEKSLVYMRENPERTLKLAGKKLLRTWNIFPNWSDARTPLYLWVSAAAAVPIFVTALVGLVVALRRREAAWILLPILVMTLTHMVFVGSVRYRLAVMPLVFALSGLGAWWIVSPVFRRPKTAAAQGAADSPGGP